MPLLKVDEPFAKPPKLRPLTSLLRWDGVVEASDGLSEFSGLEIESSEVDLSDVERLEVEGCRLTSTALENPRAELEISIAGSTIERCDLSRRRLTVVRQSRLVGVKLTGTDVSGALVRDVEFVDCVLRLTSFRMAELERVRFTNCQLDDVDAYRAELTDVSFPESNLRSLNIDKTEATRVDLRDAQLDDLIGLGRLDGFVISNHQLPALAHQLADAAGLAIADD